MSTTISKDLFSAFLTCKHKAHLLQTNCPRTSSEFTRSNEAENADFQARVRQSLLASVPLHDRPSIPSLASDLRLGTPTLFDVEIETEGYRSVVQALTRVSGTSYLGNFHYEPMLFCTASRVGKWHKLVLAFDGLVLGTLQGQMPDYGLLIHGPGFCKTRVRLSQQMPTVSKLIQQLRDQLAGNSVPMLILNPRCNTCEFSNRCVEEATANDSLSLLQGVTEKEIARCKRKGIFTLTQLSYTFRPRRRPKWAKETTRPHSFALQALALRENKIYVNGKPHLPTAATRVYFDVEGVPDRDFYYLIGVLIDSEAGQQTYSFWADDQQQQVPMLAQFVQLLSGCSDYVLYHFGSYDTGALKHLTPRIPSDLRAPFAEIQKRAVNVLSVIHSQIYFPVLANTLKNIAGHLGFRWSDDGASGLHSIMWREQWDRTRAPSLKDRLICYNLEDCQGLKVVADFVTSFEKRANGEDVGGTAKQPEVVHTSDLPRSIGRSHRFGKISFVFPELDFVNKCAYFDYQQEKVFVRTNRALRGIRSRKATQRKKIPKPNTCVELLCARCPACKSRKIAGKPASRVIIDLKFSAGGVKRWITKYRAETYNCRKCGASFLPDGYPQDRERYGHGMKSWFAHQVIVGGQDTIKVARGVGDIFNLKITTSYHRFKHSLATYYSRTYSGILAAILTGDLLHIDEAEVAIKGRTEKGYVWVLASMDAVYYLYKDSRKGDFLEEMLRGFTGVLVSDFFTAYDSVKCPQQKCVIHLLRDINEDLLRSPFDEELRKVVQPFAALFRNVVDTVDRFGLKRRHLQKHKRHALEFIDAVRQENLTSDCAVKYQKKFEKYGARLFTFLDYDGVPWNNNNAEHALKKFVKYRRCADGRFTEASLGSHLVLLSVLETCEYRSIPTLRFLLSQATELSWNAMRRAEKAARSGRPRRNIGRKRRTHLK